jgi:hypothetical protein
LGDRDLLEKVMNNNNNNNNNNNKCCENRLCEGLDLTVKNKDSLAFVDTLMNICIS